MGISRKVRRSIGLLLTFALIFASLSGFAADLSVQPKTASMKAEMAQAAAAKIDASVHDAFQQDKYAKVLIELNTQVDTSKVAAQSLQSLSQNATAYQQKMSQRYAVVEALRQTAETTQQDILNYLEKEQNQGNVKEVKSFYIMNVIYAEVTKDVLEKLSYHPEIAHISIDETIQIDLPEKSTNTLEDAIQSIEWNIDRVNAPAVWDGFGIDGSGAVIGIIDTGVFGQHEALKTRYRGYNPNDPDNPNHYGNWFDAVDGTSAPRDQHGHGTHVIGTALGQGPNGQNTIGVAPGAQWIAAQGLNAQGSGQQSWLIAAGQYLLAPEGNPALAPDIINNSWGGGPGLNEWYRPMVQAWRNAGILPVFAAGNTSGGSAPGSVSVPSNYPESYAVAATTNTNQRANFSNQGPGPYAGDLKPNISAPGANIRSAVPGGGYEGGWSGTSMAAPHVAGVAALLLSVNAALSPDDLEEIMNETAIPLTDAQYPESPNFGYGHGLVNAFDAVASIASGLGVIEGTVLREGYDYDPPTIEHDPVTSAFSGMDIPIEAVIRDNISVTKAEILVTNNSIPYWIVVPMDQVSGDHTGGTYRGAIPWMFVEEPGFDYQIRAYDYMNRAVFTPVYHVEVIFGMVPGEYYTDFSSFPIGWYTDGDWSWGDATSGPGNGYVGSKVLATNPAGNYSNNSDSWALLPPLDLREAEEASLRLNHWYDIENNWDNGFVLITADLGETWEQVLHVTGRDQQWRSLFINLNDYAGNDLPVFVLFAFTSDGSVVYPGWYLDNVSLEGEDTTPPGAPSQLEALSSSSGIQLSWQAPTDADVAGYNVYRSEVSGAEYALIASTSVASYRDTETETGSTYFYVVTAFDYSNNESGYSNEATATAPNVVLVYSENFDADNGGWTTGGNNNTWAWGEPTSGPGEAYSGQNLWATNLSGNYNNSENSWIMSPEIDLSGLETAELSFARWFNIENNFDNAYLEISTDGSSWSQLTRYTNIQQQWVVDTVSLNDYVGETVQLRYRLQTDSSVVRVGLYVDDLMITGTAEGETVDFVAAKPMITPEIAISKEGKPEAAALDFTIRKDPSEYNYTIEEELNISAMMTGLPVEAVVTVLETGRTVRTNPADGSYRLVHAANEPGQSWTLKVEAYGFYSQQTQVTLEPDASVQQNFMLEEMPRGTLTGLVVDQRTGEAIADATVQVVEDQRLPIVNTDANGAFALDRVIEGSYTVRITAANYHGDEVAVQIVGNEETYIQVELRPFIGYTAELVYDDGTAENARAFYDAGNGWAMRMTPEGMAQVTGASLYFWGTDWPSPGDNKFSVAIYDTRENGEPGSMVYQTGVLTGERGGWNYVDLSDAGFATDRDFFIAMVQVGAFPNTVGLGMDESGPFANRSYMIVGGAFQKTDASYGNFMIRGHVSFELMPPTLQSPEDQTYTNEDTIVVSGQVNADSLVRIYNNGEEVAAVEAADYQFSVEVELTEGENSLTATAEITQGVTDHSTPVMVIKDTVAPEVLIESPADGLITNREVVTVSGQAMDDHLAGVTVNGQQVDVDEAGYFSTRLIVDEGENTITVTATDLAGNSTTETVTITVDTIPPTITNITPQEDMVVRAGDQVEVTFQSDSAGGTASFSLVLATISEIEAAASSIMMEEVEPGFYRGVWTVPEGLQVTDAVILIEMYDQAGNRSEAAAPGKITVDSSSDPSKPGNPKNPKDPKDPRDPRDPKDPKDPKEPPGQNK